MRQLLITFLILICFYGYGQRAENELKNLEGIWIAEDYYNSFEKTNSAIKSKEAFYYGYPVGLRINTDEIKNGVLNIGYSLLHDHRLHPEVSDFMIYNKDTIHEQGSFKINLNIKDSIGYYKTTDVYGFNFDWKYYLTWNDNSLTLYKSNGKEYKETNIRFKRVSTKFSADYLFPNPLYYYTRKKTLKGSYILKDGKGKVLSEKFEIDEKGIAKGFEKFENLTFYFSSDIYCGLPLKSDLIIATEDIINHTGKTFAFLIDIDKDSNITFHKRQTSDIEEAYILGEKQYELIKN